MFIDPASTKTGWAVFDEKKFIASGHVNEASKDVFIRIMKLALQYSELAYQHEVEEAHIEKLPPPGTPWMAIRMFPLYYSVGAIGSNLSEVGIDVKADVAVQTWQKAVNWKSDRKPIAKYIKGVKSEDERAAIGMGKFWTEKYL